MEVLICKPQKGRLETINVEYNEENTTCFAYSGESGHLFRAIPDTKSGANRTPVPEHSGHFVGA